MDPFQLLICSIDSLSALEEMKRDIKDRVTEPGLRWDERMVLYQRVQLINRRIEQLRINRKEA